MSAQFTPGPWSVGPSHVVRKQFTDDEGRRVTRFVAEAVLSAPFVEGEREANARLIAAAPELFEALRDAGNALRFLADSITHEGSSATLLAQQGAIYEQANAAFSALAKARGDQ